MNTDRRSDFEITVSEERGVVPLHLLLKLTFVGTFSMLCYGHSLIFLWCCGLRLIVGRCFLMGCGVRGRGSTYSPFPFFIVISFRRSCFPAWLLIRGMSRGVCPTLVYSFTSTIGSSELLFIPALEVSCLFNSWTLASRLSTSSSVGRVGLKLVYEHPEMSHLWSIQTQHVFNCDRSAPDGIYRPFSPFGVPAIVSVTVCVRVLISQWIFVRRTPCSVRFLFLPFISWLSCDIDTIFFRFCSTAPHSTNSFDCWLDR